MPVAQPAFQGRHVETKVIGIVFDQIDMGQHYSAIHAYLGLREGAIRYGYDLLMLLKPQPEWAAEQYAFQFLDRRSDGFIFVAPLDRHAVMSTRIYQSRHKDPLADVFVRLFSEVGSRWISVDEHFEIVTSKAIFRTASLISNWSRTSART